LALLQKEVADLMPQKEVRHDPAPYHRPQYKNALPQQPVLGADRNAKPVDLVQAKTTEEKWRALCNYRRARGLCDHCAEKWSRNHKCAANIRLHAMQEVLDILSISDETDKTLQLLLKNS
jgi:hypothetical protein